MKIILLQSVRGLGDPGDVVNVKSGYARNYLIPKEIAVFATQSNVRQIENRITKAKEIEAERVATLKGVAEKLDKLSLKFELKAGEEDKLFGSVTTQMISDSLSNDGYTVERKDIDISDPIKTLGNHYVTIYLHKDVSAKVKIKVKALEE
jgi:large subunit ribosomal protein L9